MLSRLPYGGKAGLDSVGPPRQRRKCRVAVFVVVVFSVWGCSLCCFVRSVPGVVSFGSCLLGVLASAPSSVASLLVRRLLVFFGGSVRRVVGCVLVGFFPRPPCLLGCCLRRRLFAGFVGLRLVLSFFLCVARLCLPGGGFVFRGVALLLSCRRFGSSALSRLVVAVLGSVLSVAVFASCSLFAASAGSVLTAELSFFAPSVFGGVFFSANSDRA